MFFHLFHNFAKNWPSAASEISWIPGNDYDAQLEFEFLALSVCNSNMESVPQ